MAINRNHIGFSLPAFTVVVDPEKVREFVAAIGGSAAPPSVPPTYMKVIEGVNDSSRAIVSALGIDLRKVMHAEQEFFYDAPIECGDQLTVERRVADIYDRKGGALEFVVVESTIRNASGMVVGRSTQRILVRNPVKDASA